MATTVQIEVTVDDNGAVQGIKAFEGQVTQSFSRIKQSAQDASAGHAKALDAMNASHAELHAGLKLIERDLGIEVPKALATFVLKSEAAEHAIAALTGVAVGFAGAGVLISYFTEVANKVVELTTDLFIFTDEMKKSQEQQVAMNNRLLQSSQAAAKAQEDIRQRTHTASQIAIEDLNHELDNRQKLARQIEQQQQEIDKLGAAAADNPFYAAGAAFKKDMQDAQNELAALRIEYQNNAIVVTDLGIKAQQERDQEAEEEKQKQREIRDETIRLRNEATQAGLKGLDLIIEKEREEEQELRSRFGTLTAAMRSALQDKLAKDLDAEIQRQNDERSKQQQAAFDKEAAAYKQHEDLITGLEREATAATLSERDKVIQAEQDKIAKLNSLDSDYEYQVQLVHEATAAKLSEIDQQQYQKAQQLAQQYGSQLMAIFHDITSGKIGQAILNGFQRLFANILGQWIVTLTGMQKISAGSGSGGGLLGALLGSVLGIGGSSLGGSVVTGAGTIIPGVTPGTTPPFSSFLDAGMTTTDLVGGAAIASGTLSAGAGTGTVAAQQSTIKQIGALAALGSFGSLSKLAPLGILGSLMLGAKGGGSAIAGGALVGALGLAALYGPNAAATAAVAPFAGLLGPLAGGLIGFGVGSATGSPTAGGLSGAGSGALVGLLAGGPIGALIGGIIGGLAGLFGGIFGHGPSKHDQADKWIQANVIPAINAEVANYQGFQTDYGTAINDLEKLKTDSYNQMLSQFGHDATVDEWNKYVVPAVQQAETTIGGYNTERNRRSSINFGLPQFASGGQFRIGAGGQGLAVLDDGEVVMGRAATRMYGASNLLAMNAAANSGAPVRSASGGGQVTVVVQAWDASSVRDWLRSGGAQEIGEGIRKYWQPSYMGMGRG